jgi:hypothetical protein
VVGSIVLYCTSPACVVGAGYQSFTSFLRPSSPRASPTVHWRDRGGRCSIIDGNGVFPTVTSLGRRLSFESMRCNTIILGPGLGLRVSVGTSQLSATGLTQDLDSRQLGGCPSRLHVPRQKQSFPSQYTRTCRMLACRQSSHCPVLHRDIPEKKKVRIFFPSEHISVTNDCKENFSSVGLRITPFVHIQ